MDGSHAEMENLAGHIAVVLVEPHYSGNIGAAARAMKNMGLEQLILVNPSISSGIDALRMAHGAIDILEKMEVYPTLREAVSPMAFLYSTSTRHRSYTMPVFPPREIAPRILSEAKTNRVGIVFGPEDRGLTNDELALCQATITIPSQKAYASLNLAQAVLICCYELYLAQMEHLPASPPQLATAEKIEGMYDHMLPILLKIGFLDQNNPQRMMRSLRRIFARAKMEERDVRVLRGIFRQFDWYCENKIEK